MRELVVENQEVLIIPKDFRRASKGIVTSVSAGDFTLELPQEPQGILENTYCEFYTQTSHGRLYFDSYAKNIEGKTLTIVSPAKHKFLQRRQYTRIKYVNDFDIKSADNVYSIKTLDISAGGMKFKTQDKLDIEGKYSLTIPVSDTKTLDCTFEPIRIEKNGSEGYVVSGQLSYTSNHDKMILVQYCAKRSVEIKNK